MSSTEWPSSSSPAVTTCAILTAKSNRLDDGHDALTCSGTPAEPQISAVRGGASLVLQRHFVIMRVRGLVGGNGRLGRRPDGGVAPQTSAVALRARPGAGTVR